MARPLALFALPDLGSGGPDRVISELLHAFPRDRFTPALLVQQRGGALFDRLPDDVRVVSLETDARYPVMAFARAVRALRPAVVMTTLRMNLTAGAASPLLPRGTKLIMRQANAVAADFARLKRQSLVKHRLAERFTHWCLGRADAIVAQSMDMAAEIRAEARVGQRVATIGNPVDLAAIDAACAAQRAAAPAPLPGAPALVAVGRLWPQKGFDLLLDAMAAVRAAHPGAQLTVLGEGPERAALEAQAARLGLSGAVHFPGQSGTVLAQVAASGLFVSSSRWEGFSNAILEAMALGVPVAATTCPGATREMIGDGETGFLCPPEDAGALAEAILRALAADGQAIGQAARASVAARYDRAAIAGAYADLFESVLD